MMKAADTKIMLALTGAGSVSRVTKLSKKPAVMNIGTNPTAIFSPCFMPRLKRFYSGKCTGKQ